MILQGNIAVIPINVTNTETGVAVDPGTLVATYLIEQTETTVTYEGSSSPGPGIIARTGTGTYVLQIDTTDIANSFYGLVVTTGSGQGTERFLVEVQASALT